VFSALRNILALQTTRAAGPICQPAPSYHCPQTEHASCFRSCIGEAATAGDLAFRRQDCACAATYLRRESPAIDPHRHLSGPEGLPLRRVRTMVRCSGEHQGRFGALPSCGREASDLLGDGNAARSLDGSDGARQRSHDRGDFDSLQEGSVPTMDMVMSGRAVLEWPRADVNPSPTTQSITNRHDRLSKSDSE
jgi:hypothetical protein